MFISKRYFRVWDYLVSHSRMLIRSPANDELPCNVDLVFHGVEFLSVPTGFHGLEMTIGTHDDIKDGANIIGKHGDVRKIFLMKSAEGLYYIVAAAVTIAENTLDRFDSGLPRI